jgi:hypothetical protein
MSHVTQLDTLHHSWKQMASRQTIARAVQCLHPPRHATLYLITALMGLHSLQPHLRRATSDGPTPPHMPEESPWVQQVVARRRQQVEILAKHLSLCLIVLTQAVLAKYFWQEQMELLISSACQWRA